MGAAAFPAHGQSAPVNGASGSLGKRPMTFADLMAMKRVSDPQISPSGKWVLFSVTDVDLAKNTKVNHLWVAPMDGSAPERQVTSNTGESFGRFAPNGQFVSYTGAPTQDDPYARVTIATWDDKLGTVGVGRTLQAVSGDADGAIWSPDSRHFLFTTAVYPECSVTGGGATNTNAGVPPLRAARSGRDDGSVGGVEISGTRDVAAWKTMPPAAWADEDACDKAKDEAAEKNPVKGQVWDGLLYRHWDQYTGAKRTHIIEADFSLDGAQLNTDSNHMRDVTTARDVGDAETPTWMLGGPQEYAWAPDGKEIAYVTNLDAVLAASTNNDVFTLRLDDAGAGDAARPVKVSTSAGSDDEPEYSPDGKWLAFRSQRQAGFESDRERLMVYDREKKTARELMPKFDGWVDEFVWAVDSATIFFASGQAGEEPVLRVRLNDAKLTNCVVDGELSDLRPATDGSLVATQMLSRAPSEIIRVPANRYGDYQDVAAAHQPESGEPMGIGIRGDKPLVLTSINSSLLRQLDLPNLEPFWFTGAEGTSVEGFLIKPPNFDPAKKYPLKFLMHGGPQTAWGDAWSYRWNWELMAAPGYVVVGINRRGSTGYGQKFVDEVSGDWGGRAYEDLMKGLDYAEAKYPFIDKTRECALGASYGGFMADWVLTHTNRFKCIVTHDGLYDAAAAYGSTEEMWFPEWEFRRPKDYPKGWDGFSAVYTGKADSSAALRNDKTDDGHAAEPWRYSSLPAAEDPFRKWSPKEYIQNAKTPTLIIHSQHDYRLDVSQGFELYTALQRLGVPSRFLYFPDESHWVLKPRDSDLWNAVVSDWCDRWTKGAENRDQGSGNR